VDADRHVHPRPAPRSTPQRLKIESTGGHPCPRHGVTTPPTDRHRADHPVKVATNAAIFVFIDSDGLIVIFSAGQQPLCAQLSGEFKESGATCCGLPVILWRLSGNWSVALTALLWRGHRSSGPARVPIATGRTLVGSTACPAGAT
jgi:hypothetical protein